MRINYVLVDYENAPVKSLALLKGEQFRVRLFLGPHNTKLPVDLVLAMQELGERGQYVVLEAGGKNALDFHIAFYIGTISATDPTAYFHIVSADGGFDPLIRHLKSRKIFSSRSATIEELPCFSVPGTNGTAPQAVIAEASAKPATVNAALVDIAVADLIKRKASRPRTTKTLFSTVHATCGKDLPIAEIESLVKALVKRGFVKVAGAKVSYSLPPA